MMHFSKVDSDKNRGLEFWLKYIRKRIENNKNCLICITGQTGSGKSYAALSLMEKLNPDGLVIDNVFLKASDFAQRMASGKFKKGEVFVWDEAGIDLNAKQWQSRGNKIVNMIMQVFRKENLIVIFTLPYFSFLDSDARKLVHSLMLTEKIDFKAKEVVLKPFLIQTNQTTGKMYTKYLRISSDGGIVPVERIGLSKPDDDKLSKYEDEKDAFAKALYTNSLYMLRKAETKGQSKAVLTEKQQKIYELYKEHRNQQKVAGILGISQQNVGEQLQYVRKKLNIDKIV